MLNARMRTPKAMNKTVPFLLSDGGSFFLIQPNDHRELAHLIALLRPHDKPHGFGLHNRRRAPRNSFPRSAHKAKDQFQRLKNFLWGREGSVFSAIITASEGQFCCLCTCFLAPSCINERLEMQSVAQAIRFHGNRLKLAVLQHISMKDKFSWSNLFTRFESATSTPTLPHRGLENTTIAELLKAKGEDEAGVVYWCSTTDTVYDAVKNMTNHHIGALVVVKPGDEKLLAGIVTERDYLRKIIVQGRSSKSTRVGEIMTEENKLITVSTDTKILQAMHLMTDKHIRHVPVIDQKVVGMISIVDVVRAVVEQQHQEVKRLNEFIRGDYY